MNQLHGFLLAMVFFFLPLGTHIVWCIQRADETMSALALLVVGLFMFPVGWVHGMSVLLGMGGWV